MNKKKEISRLVQLSDLNEKRKECACEKEIKNETTEFEKCHKWRNTRTEINIVKGNVNKKGFCGNFNNYNLKKETIPYYSRSHFVEIRQRYHEDQGRFSDVQQIERKGELIEREMIELCKKQHMKI